MRTARLITIAAITASTISLTAACSADTSSRPKTTSSSKTANKTSKPKTDDKENTTPPSTSATAASELPYGIALATCQPSAGGMRVIDFIDPKTRQLVPGVSRPFMLTGEYRSLGWCNHDTYTTGAVQRSAFDAEYNTVAVVQQGVEGETRTGIMPANGVFTDLSGADQNNEYAKLPEQSTGAFGPDGKLYFVQDGALKQTDPAGDKSIEDAGFITDVTNLGDDFLFFLPNCKQPDTNARIYKVCAPGGDYAIWSGDGTISYGNPANPSSAATTDMVAGRTVWPFAYISRTEFLATNGDDMLFRATIAGKKVTLKPLMPSLRGDDPKVIDPTLGPDGKVAFIYQTSTKREILTVPADGGVPEHLWDIPREATGTNILGWTNGR